MAIANGCIDVCNMGLNLAFRLNLDGCVGVWVCGLAGAGAGAGAVHAWQCMHSITCSVWSMTGAEIINWPDTVFGLIDFD